MRVQTIVIGLILFGLVVGAFASIIYDGKTYYNLSYTGDDFARLNKINETYVLVNDAGQTIQGGETLSQTGVTQDLKLTSGIKKFYDAIKTAPTLIGTVAEFLMVPAWFVVGILAIFVVVLVMSIIYLIGVIQGGTGK